MASSLRQYTFDQINKACPPQHVLSRPIEGLLYIVVTTPINAGHGPGPKRTRRGNKSKGWRNGGSSSSGELPKAVLQQPSANSFAVRKRIGDQDQSTKLIGEIRVLLNKVTDDNLKVLITEAKDVLCPKMRDLLESLESDEQQEALLTQLANLFVQKAQVDHAFSKWYAQLAAVFVLPDFGDILYEVCRDALPALRYEPDNKRKYLGALLLLVELRRCDMVTLTNLEAAAEKIFVAVERNLGNLVMATTSEAPIDQATQIEVCVELLCHYLTAFFALEKPAKETLSEYLKNMKDLSDPKNKDRVKPRSQFMLKDFFAKIKL